ncbi:glycosyltransferase family 2 protein [Morganella morganii]|uniref:glycosyltransferase family 2 protein n=1 Tax=Morganella morganii TaxID=582 RepID=UPI0021D2CDAF|nr:glycosyltransferase family 2 protein [Morganella morganii]MCU6210685.1 glycosyltransferase family 2 protein [Morganella morganii]
MENNLISIIMPAFNAEDTIYQSINSALNQTFEDFHLYIINDASTDNTDNIIRGFSDPRITYIKNNVNQGVAACRNIGIKKANSKYISFLDSDDIWLPQKLEQQLKHLNIEYDIVCSNYSIFHSDTNVINKVTKFPSVINYSMMLKSNFIGNLTGIYNSEKLGKEYQKNKGHEDYIMWLNLLKRSGKAYCIQEPLAKYRISNQSLSGNKLKAIKWQWSIYRNELKLSLPKSIYYFSHYIINALKKRR